MTLTFIEVTGFTRIIQEYFGSDDAFRLFQSAILEDPECGSVIQGCGGLRKVRWRDSRRGKGTRGGLRVIYLYVPEAQHILLLDVYDKDEASDLTKKEREALAAMANRFRDEILRTYRSGKRA